MGERIAVVGSGISGLGAAWALQREHEVVVYEADGRVGGHSNTVDVPTPDGVTSVDTGFIVYNEVTYPNLTRLFDALEVATEPSDMSFAFSRGGFEYGASLRGMLARPANLTSPRFIRMLRDINRFRRVGVALDPGPEETLDQLLTRHGFSRGFLDDYLFPMAGAIWSARQSQIRQFPATSILRFLANHGLIEIAGRPRWRTVSGGSRSYVRKLTAPFADKIRLSSPVLRLRRMNGRIAVDSRTGTDTFDHVVLATHSDQARKILEGSSVDLPMDAYRALLGAIAYEPNEAVLHSDAALMPRRSAVWSSWNAIAPFGDTHSTSASVTYWMNRLQNLPKKQPLFVTLNPWRDPDTNLVYGRFRYAHPQFTAKAIAAQKALASLQGTSNVWLAGAYLGYGFHEDGLQSGLNVAEALKSPAPWHGAFTPVSSAPAAPSAPVRL